MRKSKFFLISFFVIIFSIMISQISFAKYSLNKGLDIQVYIDKTPPVIKLDAEGKSEEYSKTDLENIIEKSTETKITTSDNIAVKENKFSYNPSEPNFDEIEKNKFESGTTFTEDGYYKIVTEDTSGNTTEIIILIDKTPPEVEVNFYKKGEIADISDTEIISIAATKKFLLAENVIDSEETKTEETKTEESKIESSISLMAARSTATVFNENDFKNAINNKITDIVWWTSFQVTSTIYIDYNVTIHPATNENAMQFNGYGNFLVVQNGGTLNLTSMVVDTNGNSKNRGVTAINVQSGGRVVFREGTIIDGGATNTGLLINGGGTALFYSGHVANSTKGIVVKSNGNLSYSSLGDGRTSEAWSNSTAISFENFTGTCNFSQTNIRIRNNTNGIVIESSTGTVNVFGGQYYSNSSNGIVSKAGNINISGGSIYSNGTGINFGAGNLKITGGSIYSNSTGVLLNSSYTGKMTMTGGNISSNSSYAINHGQNADGCCTITGGTVSGTIYLAQSDNYVNTNSSYPILTVKPSSYYFKRKLVKTTSNAYANNEISKVTMTPNGSWYKYVEDEYIKVWQGCNVKVNCLDYYGNVISTETLNGNLGDSYETTAKEIEGYDLISSPENAKGIYTQNDIIVEYKYDLVNVAIVNYEDLLSGVKTAKYWFSTTENGFSGEGINFENNKLFEDYGYYKIEVINNVGLKREITFALNKNSLIR